MNKRKAKEGEEILTLKVSMRQQDITPEEEIYRTMAIPDGFSLYKLANVITNNFDFYFDHCFGYYDNTKNYINSNEGYELFQDIGEDCDYPGVKKTKVKQVFNKMKKKMLFLFDYGDTWHFIVELIAKEAPEVGKKYPIIIESFGKAPLQYEEYEEEFDDENEDEE